MAITTNTEYKTWAGITATTWDSLITTLISAASRRAEIACNRTRTASGATSFESGTWTEVFNGEGQEAIQLRNWPITSVTSVTLTAGDGTTIRTVASTEYKINLANGVLAFAPSYAGRFARVSSGDGFGPGWGSDYDNGSEHGVHPRFSDQYRNVTVVYVGGYSTVPDDLKMAIWQIVDLLFNMRANDPTVKSESIGVRSVTYADGNFGKITNDEIRAIMGPYASPLP